MQRAQEAMDAGRTPIAIDNTNLEAWEAHPYLIYGQKVLLHCFSLAADRFV